MNYSLNGISGFVFMKKNEFELFYNNNNIKKEKKKLL